MQKKEKEIIKESEFGLGLVYNLFLFAKHWSFISELKEHYEKMYPDDKDEAYSRWIETWANGASDHFYDMQIGEGILPKKLTKRIKKLQEKALEIGHGFTGKKYTEKDFEWLFSESEDICMEIDKYIGIPTIKAKWN